MERWDCLKLVGFWEVGGGLRGGRSFIWGYIGVCEMRIKFFVNIVWWCLEGLRVMGFLGFGFI